MDLSEQLVDAWRINDRVNRFLLDSLDPSALDVPLTKGKKVGAQFAHIHNVRLMWLKAAAPDLLTGLEKLDEPHQGPTISSALIASADAVSKLLERSIPLGKIKNFKPHPAAFVGYLISHEANHRGQAEIALRQAGVPLPDKVSYGLWEWGVR